MSIINSSIASIMPYFPKWLVRPFASPYVAGETINEVLKIVEDLNNNGFEATIDILGEFVQSEKQAKEVLESYSKLIKKISKQKLKSTVSIKLTHLGLEIDKKLAENNFSTLIKTGKDCNVNITIDMENSVHTNSILEIYKNSLKIYDGIGTVIQAYLFRSQGDLKNLDSDILNLRICKGIYKESKDIAIQDRQSINKNFLKIAKQLLLGKGYACLATHDLSLIQDLENFIENKNIDIDKFEFQALHGVPIQNKLIELQKKGYKVRIYVPFGPEWFEYSIRRIKENPKIISYILKNIFSK